MRALIVGIVTWLGLILAGAAFGGLMSLYTGKTAELSKWNGWSYFAFCVQEGAMFAAMLTWPITLIVLLIAYAGSRRRDAA